MLNIFLQSLIVGGGLFWLGRKVVDDKFKRWGGIVLIVVFWAIVFFHRELEITKQLQGILVGSVGILFFGILDDWKKFSWWVQIIFQIGLVVLLVRFGFEINYFAGIGGDEIRIDQFIWQGISVGSAMFIFFWVVGIMNAVNWVDGVDSSMGAVALVGGMSLIFVSFLPEVNQPAIAILASVFLGVIMSFLFFNFPPAKVEAGTSGSYFVGFILATLAIIAGSKIVTLMIVLILPLIDFILVVIERWRGRRSIFKRDNSHLHYQLRKIGWSDWKIFLSYFIFLSGILVLYSLLDNRMERVLLLLVEGVFIAVAILKIRRHSH